MQKKQGVIKGLFFGLFGIIGFSSFTFAAIVANSDPNCLTTEQDKCSTYNIVDEKAKYDQCILDAASKCSTSIQTPAQCILSCGSNNPDCVTKCQCTSTETYNETTKACESNPTGGACNVCKANFCANATVSCDKAQAEAACAIQCATGTSYNTVMGITINPECLKNGQCGLNIYDLLGMKGKNTSATIFVQDVLLSATLFIGTIITIALIYSGIMYIMAGVNGKDPSKAKNGIIYSIIGLLLVISSYTIIRLVQYIAKGL